MSALFSHLLFAYIVFPGPATPGEGIRFHGLTTEEGLSEGTVYCIMQDRLGFIWFGTRDGLNRFNGIDFDVYRYNADDPESLSSSYIYKLAEDVEGKIWIAGQGGGLDCYDPVTNRFIRQSALGGPVMGSTVGSVLVDSRGLVWAATERAGLFKRDTAGNYTRLTHDPNDPSSLSENETWEVVEDRLGYIWVSMGEKGVNRLDPATGKIMRHKTLFPNADSLPREEVWPLSMGTDGALLTGYAGSGLWRVDPDTLAAECLLPPGINGIDSLWVTTVMQDRSGTIWAGTRDNGLFVIEDGVDEPVQYIADPVDPYSLLSNSLKAVFQDRAGSVWIGHYGMGVDQVNATGLVFKHYRATSRKDGLQGSLITAVESDRKGNVWVGTDHGLNHFDDQGNLKALRFRPDESGGLSDESVTALKVDSRDRLWVGTVAGGLNMMQGMSGRFRAFRAGDGPNDLLHNRVSSITEDPSGRIWVGTFKGLTRLEDADTGRFVQFKAGPGEDTLNEAFVSAMAVDGTGVLWAGTWGGGLSRYDERKKRFSHFTRERGTLINDTVWDLHTASNGDLWAGTNGGLIKWDGATITSDLPQSRTWLEENGLPGNVVYAVESDTRGNIWLGTNRGLVRLKPHSGHMRIFTPRDGIQDWVFSAGASCLDEKGRLYFGGKKGLNMFSPDKLNVIGKPPRTVLTRLMIANEVVNPRQNGPRFQLERALAYTDELKFSYRDRVFSLEVAALDFTAPKQHRYRYKLEGFDEDWIETSALHRRITYTNLDPDQYVFRASAATLDGEWNQEEATIQIAVSTPPWRTWWAYALYILMPIGLFMVYTISLERKVRSRTEALFGTRRKLMEAAKMAGMAEIATDVLHNVGNIINSVKISVHVVREVISGDQWRNFFERLLVLLRQHEDALGEVLGHPKRGGQMVEGLERIMNDVSRRCEQVTEESDKLEDHLQDIVAILREQQEYTMTRGWALEIVDLPELIRHALEMEAYLFREKPVDVIEELMPVPMVKVERTRFNRIIIFLLTNAVEGIEARGEPGIIRITTRKEKDMVEICMTDNGIGIDRESLGQVFVHGFTTKQHHKGFGLHFCANAMKEMEGSIAVESPGPGKGVTARLQFPIPEMESGKTRFPLMKGS